MYYRIRLVAPRLRQTLMALLLSVFLSVPAAQAAPPEKILILPFTIHAEKDMAFLNQGMMSMLLSRLAKPGKTTTESVSELPGTPKQIQALALSRGAKYYTTGSLTLFGNSVSTDARLIDTETGKMVVAFSQYGERAGDVLAHMDAFSRQIDAQLTAVPKPNASPLPESAQMAAPPAAATIDAAVSATPALPVVSAPPAPMDQKRDENVKAGAGVASSPPPAAETAGDRVIYFESQNLGEEIRSITTGDLDGDGTNEIVCAGNHRVSVYRFEGGKLQPMGGYTSGKEYSIISVDAVDVNGNGRSEVFVTRLMESIQSKDPNMSQRGLNTVVLEQQNGRLMEIADGLNYYIRAIVLPGNERRLLAQKRGVLGTYGEQNFMNTTGGLFLGNVFNLTWKNGEYTPGDPILLPKDLTVYDFTLGDILNNGSETITALKSKGYLTLLEPGGKKIWSGDERFGGSLTYLEYPSMEGSSQMDRYYIRQRIFITDIDGDGSNEVILANNHDTSRALAARVRIYNNGRIACLGWAKRSLKAKWETEEINGYISDLAVADVTGDGRQDLVYAIVEKSKSSVSDGESILVIQTAPTADAHR